MLSTVPSHSEIIVQTLGPYVGSHRSVNTRRLSQCIKPNVAAVRPSETETTGPASSPVGTSNKSLAALVAGLLSARSKAARRMAHHLGRGFDTQVQNPVMSVAAPCMRVIGEISSQQHQTFHASQRFATSKCTPGSGDRLCLTEGQKSGRWLELLL